MTARLRMGTTLRTKPLPTLPERRRLIVERLVRTQAEIDRLVSAREFGKAGLLLAEEGALIRVLAYLGEPDKRLDLYRLFGMELPKA